MRKETDVAHCRTSNEEANDFIAVTAAAAEADADNDSDNANDKKGVLGIQTKSVRQSDDQNKKCGPVANQQPTGCIRIHNTMQRKPCPCA